MPYRKPDVNKTALFRGIALGGAAFGVLAAVIIQPTLAADASNGERLAMRWCAACHVVACDQREASADAPPFVEIAKRPNFSESGLMTFLLDPHAKMPNMNLTRFEAGDIAAYVSGLRWAQGRPCDLFDDLTGAFRFRSVGSTPSGQAPIEKRVI
jgi:mono/diheme cytochrome c family protein